ncbi:MAG: sigma-70 family RNA polymerase sigma factor [Phycisphaeraceae bacterium]|nr:sigma-70 family RNA polymerase sigma factor [Phycisphaeraceae bacterium]
MPRPDSNRTESWRAFYAEHGSRLKAFAVALVGGSQSEDLVQEALVRLIRRGDSPPLTIAYALTTMRRIAIDAGKRKRRSDGKRQEALRSEASVPRDEEPDVQALVLSLSDAERQTIALRLWCGLGFPQIAEILEEPVGTTRARYSRALSQLRAQISPSASEVLHA